MGSAIARLFAEQGDSTPVGPSAVARLYQGETTPQLGRTGPGEDQLRELLQRPDLSPDQRLRVNRLLNQMVEARTAPDESVVIEAAKSFAQGVADPFVGAAQTLSRIPVIGAPLRPVARAGQGLLAALEPSDVGEQHPWVQTGARVAGNFVGYMMPWKAASAVVSRLGAAAATRAPTLAARASSKIVAASEAAGRMSPTLGQAVLAAPQELATGLMLQGITAPGSMATPEGLGWTAATSLGGLFITGFARARQIQGRLRTISEDAKKATDATELWKLQQAADAARREADELAEQAARIPGLKVTDKRGTKAKGSDLPTQLEVANTKITQWHEQALGEIQARLTALNPPTPESIEIAGDAFGLVKPGETWDFVKAELPARLAKMTDKQITAGVQKLREAGAFDRVLQVMTAAGVDDKLEQYAQGVWKSYQQSNVLDAVERMAVGGQIDGLVATGTLRSKSKKLLDEIKTQWWKDLGLKDLGYAEPPPLGLVETAAKGARGPGALITTATQGEVGEAVRMLRHSTEDRASAGLRDLRRGAADPALRGSTPEAWGNEPRIGWPHKEWPVTTAGGQPAELGIGGSIQGMGGAIPEIVPGAPSAGGAKLPVEASGRKPFGPRPGQERGAGEPPTGPMVIDSRAAAVGSLKDVVQRATAISAKRPNRNSPTFRPYNEVKDALKRLQAEVRAKSDPTVLQSAMLELRASVEAFERPMLTTPRYGRQAAILDDLGQREVAQGVTEGTGPRPGGPINPTPDLVDWALDPHTIDPDELRGHAHKPLPGTRTKRSFLDYELEDPGNTPDWTKEILKKVKRPAPRESIIPKSYADMVGRAKSLVQSLVHSGSPFGAVDEELLGGTATLRARAPIQRSSLAMYEMARGSTSTYDHILKHGGVVPQADGTLVSNPNIPAFADVLKEVKSHGPGSLDQFFATMIAQRRLGGNYKNAAFPEEVVAAQWTNRPAWFDEAFAKWQTAKNGARSFGEFALSPGTSRIWDVVEPNHINLTRAFEPPEIVRSALSRSARAPRTPFEELKGGTGDVVDPFFSTLDQTERSVRGWYYNRAATTFADMVDVAMESNPEGLAKLGIYKKVALDPETHKDLFEAARNLKANLDQISGVPVDLQDALEFTMQFRGVRSKAPGNTVSVWRNGEINQYYVPTDIAQAFNALRPAELAWWVKIMGVPSQALKMGITQNPMFQLMNFVRDSWDAHLNSRYGFTFGADSMKGLAEAFKKGPVYREWLANGGAFGTLSTSDVRTTAGAIRSVGGGSKGLKGRVLHAVDAYREFTAHFEEAARLGEYMKAKGAGASALEAAYASRKVTVDFSQMGLTMAGLSHMTAFLNPGIQALWTTGKAIQHHPASFALKGLTGIALPSFYLWWANKDDPEIQELRRTEAGMTSWFVRLPTGAISRIPKPFLYGQVFGSTIEATLDQWANKDPEAVGRWRQAVAEQVGFQMLPTFMQTGVSLWANKDVFTGMPIVPQDMVDVASRYQTQLHTARLTELFTQMPGMQQALGLVGLDSPARFEYVLRQLGGTLAVDAWRGIDLGVVRQMDPHAPATPVAADWPVLGRMFARYPTLGTRSVREFYTNASKVGQVANTVNYLLREQPDQVQAYITDPATQQRFALAGLYADARREIGEMRNSISLIQKAPIRVMNPERKRELIDTMLNGIIELTSEINAAVEAQPEARQALYPSPAVQALAGPSRR